MLSFGTMYKIQTNPYLNRITVTLSGRLDAVEAVDAHASLLRELNRMKPGFDAVVDFRFLREVSAESAAILPLSLDAVSKAGAARAVRIVGASREGLVAFAAHSKDFQEYPIKYVRTIQEAERHLAEKVDVVPT